MQKSLPCVRGGGTEGKEICFLKYISSTVVTEGLFLSDKYNPSVKKQIFDSSLYTREPLFFVCGTYMALSI